MTGVLEHPVLIWLSCSHDWLSTWVYFLETESSHHLIKVTGGGDSVAGDDRVQVHVIVLQVCSVTEVLHWPHHPVSCPIPLPPPVRHVDIGVRSIVTLTQTTGRETGAEHDISEIRNIISHFTDCCLHDPWLSVACVLYLNIQLGFLYRTTVYGSDLYISSPSYLSRL